MLASAFPRGKRNIFNSGISTPALGFGDEKAAEPNAVSQVAQELTFMASGDKTPEEKASLRRKLPTKSGSFLHQGK